MFGRRPDGKLVKGMDGMARLMPLVMKNREGSANFTIIDQPTKYFDEFIERKKSEGEEYTYRDIMIAVLVRLFAIRPKLNRFIVGGRFYQRNWIDFAMVVHKSLRTGEEETAVKARFTGNETIAEIKKTMDAAINKAVFGENDTDKKMGLLNKLPHFMLKIVAAGLKLLDRWGWLSNKFMLTSPFHTSIFFSDLKSIKLDNAHHHLYNFGNCGFFLMMCKEKLIPLVDKKTGEVKAEGYMNLCLTMDERFADGLYYNRVLNGLRRITENLSCLDRPPAENEILHLKTYEEIKAEQKEKKLKAKEERKENKRKSKEE